jgi:reactive chlorine resistance protein C
MYTVLSPVGVSRILGVIEIVTAFLLLASPWMPLAGVAGGALGVLTFCVTLSILGAIRVWEAGASGLPAATPCWPQLAASLLGSFGARALTCQIID